MRKFLLLAAIVCVSGLLLCATAPVSAFVLSPAEEAQLQTEKPLTQADIDTFITYGPALIKAFKTNDADKGKDIFLRIGWNKIRCIYIISKIGNGYCLSIQPRAAKAMLEGAGTPAVLMPSAAELELIKQNLSALTDIFGSLARTKTLR